MSDFDKTGESQADSGRYFQLVDKAAKLETRLTELNTKKNTIDAQVARYHALIQKAETNYSNKNSKFDEKAKLFKSAVFGKADRTMSDKINPKLVSDLTELGHSLFLAEQTIGKLKTQLNHHSADLEDIEKQINKLVAEAQDINFALIDAVFVINQDFGQPRTTEQPLQKPEVGA